MSHQIPPSSVAELPDTMPLLPLLGQLLLPGERLPVSVHEPRYTILVDEALSWHKMIGIIQPVPDAARERSPRLCTVGCAGRITSFTELDHGRYQIILTGICRFKIMHELLVASPYRQAQVDFSLFAHDLIGAGVTDEPSANRPRLMQALRNYLVLHKVADWTKVQNLATEALINWLGMICPFDPREKQALLEARTMAEREAIFMAIIEMAVFGRTSPVPG